MPRHVSSPLEALLVDRTFDGELFPEERMARHTTYHIGGPARYFVRVESYAALRHLLAACEAEGVPCVVVGRGSNLLVADRGFPGVVVTLGRDFCTRKFCPETNRFMVGAGVPLAKLVQDAFRRSVAGLEFAVGTPGSVGGALRMNAGTDQDWLGSRVLSVTSLSAGKLVRYEADDIRWGYRTSSLPESEIIVECELSVEPADPMLIRGKMEALLARRKRTQPLGEPSCGSVFRNPVGFSAGQLIESAGLKGASVGGAMVSPVHANFIVNTGNAKAAHVLELMETVQSRVYEAHGIELQPEVRLLGFA